MNRKQKNQIITKLVNEQIELNKAKEPVYDPQTNRATTEEES